MALGRAAAIGAIAASAVPYAMRNETGQLGDLVHRGVIRFPVGGVHLHWSWPLFGIVTLFAWGFLAWADR